MFDFFNHAAKARLKAVEEALEVERTRTAELTRQLIAMADTKAFKVLHPNEVRTKIVTDRNVIRSPLDAPDSNAYIRQVRDNPKQRES